MAGLELIMRSKVLLITDYHYEFWGGRFPHEY